MVIYMLGSRNMEKANHANMNLKKLGVPVNFTTKNHKDQEETKHNKRVN